MAQRLFFALLPDAEACRALATVAAATASATGGRAPPAENLHVTVAFLGQVADERTAAVLAIGARAAANATSFVLELDRAGMFRDAGIAWLGTRAVPQALQDLFEALRADLSTEGFRTERRSFHPHVTLARRALRPPAESGVTPIGWRVDALTLMASKTLPGGARYAAMASWPLRSDA